MKKKMLVLCSLITLLLAAFQFPIYADEDSTDTPSVTPIPNSIRLDSYFYENYDLLPYIESNGNQYIDTGIKGSSNLLTKLTFSLIDGSGALFGEQETGADYCIRFNISNNNRYLYNYYSNRFEPLYNFNNYNLNYLVLDRNVFKFNDYSYTFSDDTFLSTKNIYIFASNAASQYKSSYRLYSFSIYDYSSESYSRYYYPARSKSGSVIGLYDAVSDTFVTTLGSVPFTSPVQDQVLNFQIGNFLTSSIGWITDILEFAIETPIILIFMAIGLAGAMFRWSRRLVHF